MLVHNTQRAQLEQRICLCQFQLRKNREERNEQSKKREEKKPLSVDTKIHFSDAFHTKRFQLKLDSSCCRLEIFIVK
jgi:hypothetical protein